MSIEPRAPSGSVAGDAARDTGAWRRFLAWIAAFEEAMDTSYDDIQDRRILALEAEVARLGLLVESVTTSKGETSSEIR